MSLALLLSVALLCLDKMSATLAAMMANTTINSINENPLAFVYFSDCIETCTVFIFLILQIEGFNVGCDTHPQALKKQA